MQGQADGSVMKNEREQRRSSSARPRRRRLDKDWKQLRTTSSPPHPQRKKIEWSPLEREIVQEFTRELADVLCDYVEMTYDERRRVPPSWEAPQIRSPHRDGKAPRQIDQAVPVQAAERLRAQDGRTLEAH